MSGSNSQADAIRAALASERESLTILSSVTASGTEIDLGTHGQADVGLTIDNTTQGTTSALFLSHGFSFIENVDDTSPVVASGTNKATPTEYYQGDSGGQYLVTGAGDVFAAMTGFGNTVLMPTTGGVYTIATGLANAVGDVTMLAAPVIASGIEAGNTIVAGAGQASIAAGLGANGIFLGAGQDTVASEGLDTIFGGSGTSLVFGAEPTQVIQTYPRGILFYASADSGAAGASNTLYGNAESVTVFGGAGTLTAFGGSAGNNVLVGGSGTSVLVGGGANDWLVAGSATSTLVAGTGNETLFGGGGNSTSNFFTGGAGSHDSVIAGTGINYVQFGAGNSTVFSGSGFYDLYGVQNGSSGGNDQIVGFNAAHDYLVLQGFDTSTTTPESVFVNDVSIGYGNSSITLSDNTHIVLFGVTNLTSANIIVAS